MKISIRPACAKDTSLILSLIRELAEFEKLLHEVKASEDSLRATLFGPGAVPEVLIAEADGQGVGYGKMLIRMDRALQVTIPVIVKGESKGVKQQGGILEFVRREIVVECLPADIPEHVDALARICGDRLRWIFVTHTHRDHSPAARALAARTGAQLLGNEKAMLLVADDQRRGKAFALGAPDRFLDHCARTD